MLVDLLLESTEVHWKLSKARRTLRAEEKAKWFCIAARWGRLRSFVSVTRKMGVKTLQQQSISILHCFASSLSGLSEAGKVSLRKGLKCSNCGLLKYLNLKKRKLRFWCTFEIRCMLWGLFWICNSFVVTDFAIENSEQSEK